MIKENDLKGLSLNGFGEYGEEDFKELVNSPRLERIQALIKKYFKSKVKGFFNLYSSYMLKRVAQKYIGEYVSSGEFIYAMHLEGFRVKKDSVNAYFNIKESDVNVFLKCPEVLNILKASSECTFEFVYKYDKRYLAYKYCFRYMIDKCIPIERRFKRYIIKVIAAELNEEPITISYWFDIQKNDKAEIPEDKLMELASIFNKNVNKFKFPETVK